MPNCSVFDASNVCSDQDIWCTHSSLQEGMMQAVADHEQDSATIISLRPCQKTGGFLAFQDATAVVAPAAVQRSKFLTTLLQTTTTPGECTLPFSKGPFSSWQSFRASQWEERIAVDVCALMQVSQQKQLDIATVLAFDVRHVVTRGSLQVAFFLQDEVTVTEACTLLTGMASLQPCLKAATVKTTELVQ